MRNKMTIQEIKDRFNSEGVFPSDEEMTEAIMNSGEYFTEIEELEDELITIAMNDSNHPYHPMVVPLDIGSSTNNEING